VDVNAMSMQTQSRDFILSSQAPLADSAACATRDGVWRRGTRWIASNPERFLHRVSLALLLLWCVGWGVSLAQGELVGVKKGWFPGCFGVDFIWHVDKPTRIWLAGGDQYADKGRMCSYPPLTMRFFAWVGALTPNQALTVWICAVAVMAAAGGVAAWKCRRRLQLDSIPLSFVLVAVLYSTPLVFAMERGQYDPLVVPMIMLALPLLGRESRWSQIAAGALLALTPWLKVYPGLLGVGLAGLRRWDALASFAVVGLAIATAIPGDTERWLVNNELHMEEARSHSRLEHPTRIHPWNHSLSDNWPRIWNGTPVRLLSRINGYVATAMILGPMLLVVSRRLLECPQRDVLAFPYLLWIVALAAFVPPVANDYSLVVLPLAAFAVCGRRDPLSCRLAILALIVWWQPIRLPIDGRILILLKLAALGSIGVSLIHRARELNAAVEDDGRLSSAPTAEPARLAA
jgi:hypothetical protein